jgi:hypothetical protein
MYFGGDPASSTTTTNTTSSSCGGEPIETVNATVVGVYDTHTKAKDAARQYFFESIGGIDSSSSRLALQDGVHSYYWSAKDNDECLMGTASWDEEVYVQTMTLQ